MVMRIMKRSISAMSDRVTLVALDIFMKCTRYLYLFVALALLLGLYYFTRLVASYPLYYMYCTLLQILNVGM
jgi:hypothetical protein